MPARRAFIDATHADMAQNAICDQAQARGNFELRIFATHTGGEDCRIATPDTRTEHQCVAGEARRVGFDAHHQLVIEVRGSGKRMPIDDGVVAHDRNGGSLEPRLRLALGAPDQAIRAPGAECEL